MGRVSVPEDVAETVSYWCVYKAFKSLVYEKNLIHYL